MAQPKRTDSISDRRKTLRFSDEELQRIQLAAKQNYQSFSDFARDAMVTAASETLGDDEPNDGGDGLSV